MKLSALYAAACAALALGTANAFTIEVEYYPKEGCKTGGTKVAVSNGAAHCVNLKAASNSLKVVGTAKLPNGCTLQAFQAKNCGSFEVDFIDGPSLNKCSAADNNSGSFKSIRVTCD